MQTFSIFSRMGATTKSLAPRSGVDRAYWRKVGRYCQDMIAVWLIFYLAVFTIAVPVFAEEPAVSPEPEPTATEQTTPQDGQAGQDVPSPSPDPTSEQGADITTGDATASTDIENEVNTNIAGPDTHDTEATPTPEASPTTESLPSEHSPSGSATSSGSAMISEPGPAASSSPEVLPTEISSSDGAEADPQGTVENTNSADVYNTSETLAATGTNEATTTAGTAEIETGNAAATVNLVNVVNTNITGSTGLFLLLSALGLFGDLDLRSALSGSDPCGGQCANPFGVVFNINAATIANDITAGATTGDNTASSTHGSLIRTGNAYAGVNVLNLVNTNITGSNYLVLMLNNFGNWGGDLVFPSKYSFFQNTGDGCCASGSADVSNTNSADIANNVSVDADTGENSVEGGGAVGTGNAAANANVMNQTNTNIFDSDSLVVVIRVYGDWLGTVFSAPDNVFWQENNGSISLFTAGGAPSGESGRTSVATDNAASITNNVRVFALTGNNRIDAGGGQIHTGNAAAAANIANVANTNIFGRNWVVALINIFGNWHGNIAFGRPDLWVGQKILNIPSEVRPGSEIEYELTVANRGDTDATDVVLRDTFHGTHLSPVSVGEGRPESDGISWNLGALKPRESRTIRYRLAVNSTLPYGSHTMTHTALVQSHETDGNSSDNAESTHYALFHPTPPVHYSFLELYKTNSATSTVVAGSNVDYKIELLNRGAGGAYDVVVTDTLTYESEDQPLETKQWQLGEVFPYEDITIEYALQLASFAPPGKYVNTVTVFARDAHGFSSPFYLQTHSDITVVSPPDVLAAGGGPASRDGQGTATSTEAQITKKETSPPPSLFPISKPSTSILASSTVPVMPAQIPDISAALLTPELKQARLPDGQATPVADSSAEEIRSDITGIPPIPDQPVATRTQQLFAAALGAMQGGHAWVISGILAGVLIAATIIRRRRAGV